MSGSARLAKRCDTSQWGRFVVMSLPRAFSTCLCKAYVFAPNSTLLGSSLDSEKGCNIERTSEVQESCRTAVMLNDSEPLQTVRLCRRVRQEVMGSSLELVNHLLFDPTE